MIQGIISTTTSVGGGCNMNIDDQIRLAQIEDDIDSLTVFGSLNVEVADAIKKTIDNFMWMSEKIRRLEHEVCECQEEIDILITERHK
jgi:predicted CoA-binding protein